MASVQCRLWGARWLVYSVGYGKLVMYSVIYRELGG